MPGGMPLIFPSTASLSSSHGCMQGGGLLSAYNCRRESPTRNRNKLREGAPDHLQVGVGRDGQLAGRVRGAVGEERAVPSG